MHAYKSVLWLLGIILIACNGSSQKEPDPKLTEAFAIHEHALHVLDSLEQVLASVEVDSLPTTQQVAIKEIKEEIEAWESNLVEVPGFEHEHDHDHEGHDHHHHDATSDQMADLPPQDMLDAQQAFLDELHKIGQRIPVALADTGLYDTLMQK